MGIINIIIIMIRASDTAIFARARAYAYGYACTSAMACRRSIWQGLKDRRRTGTGTDTLLWLAHLNGVCGIFGQTMRTGHEEEDIWRDTLLFRKRKEGESCEFES